MIDVFAVYGAGGYAREVMPLLKKTKISNENNYYFIDDNIQKEGLVNGTKVLTYEKLLYEYPSHNICCSIAIANFDTRRLITEKCKKNGVKIISIKADNCFVMDEVNIGEGAILSPFVTITSNVKIGKSFHANLYSYVGHDCMIGNYVTFAPGVKCNGNVEIHDNVYIGTGAIIHQGKSNKPIIIGKNSKIAAGAVVTKNIPENVTVIGNPAQVLTKEVLKKMRSI